ncbi:hypothetical protein ABG768_026534 [Culter alburnus]|uniref:Ig-like domain-containing protein n=1 Tax=Culter alburnus TaxID=194366 RepID=A0AAW2AAC9_CULAL
MGNLKISALLLFAMATLHCGISESMDYIEGNCNEVIKLPCKATDRTTTYRYAMWYKMKDIPIIKRKKREYTNYTNSTSFFLGENETLEVHNVQPSDSGEYKCYLAADVGSQNYYSFIKLNVSASECLDVSTVYPSTTNPVYCPVVEELTVHWAVIGLSLFSMAKIILCIVAVGQARTIAKNGRWSDNN